MAVNTSIAQSKDSVKLVSLSNLKFSSNNTFFDGFDYSLELKKQLKGYHIQVYGVEEIKRGSIYFTTLSLKKSYFRDNNNIYNYDLNLYLPKPIDMSMYRLHNRVP